jgi:DNA-binding phage protein
VSKGFTYKSYSFVDKDPIIDEVRTVFRAAGVTKQWVADESGVTAQTLHNWFEGATRRPQAATVNAVLRALGKRLGIVDLEAAAKKEIPSGMRHVVPMAKIRRRG